MTQTADFGFYFEAAGKSAEHGATSSDEEHFKEVSMAEALVREMGQNSLDARITGSTEPVRMEFELRKLQVGEIPDFDNLRRHVLAADETTRHIDAANRRLVIAAEAVEQPELYVLRIGDYGTTGLTGSESSESIDSPLVALTRGRGISAGKVGKGGSFGVGASTGALASAIRTVLWASLPVDSDQVVFAGQSQLATHTLDGVRRGPDGFFIDRNFEADFRYLRSSDPLGSFAPRRQTGTDTFILGYLDADNDPQLLAIRDAFVRNFFVAIDRGILEVEGKTSGSNWKLDASSLADVVMSYEDVFPFYKALQNPPYTETVKGLGNLQLYMEFDDALPKKLDTVAMRAPLMKVTTFTHHSIKAKYAAVFLCESEPGNTVLRQLEPPAHDKWVPNRQLGGKQTVTKVKEFIKNGLKSRLQVEAGEEIRMAEVEKLLPAGLGEGSMNSVRVSARPQPDLTRTNAGEESSTVHASTDPVVPKTPTRQTYRVGIPTRALSGGDLEGLAGRRGGGKGSLRSTGGSKPTSVQKGEGSARITDTNFKMRSWTESKSGDIILRLRTDRPANGDITLAALSDGGAPEKSFKLPIRRVVAIRDEEESELKFSGNTIHGVTVSDETHDVTLRIQLFTNDRYRLDIV